GPVSATLKRISECSHSNSLDPTSFVKGSNSAGAFESQAAPIPRVLVESSRLRQRRNWGPEFPAEPQDRRNDRNNIARANRFRGAGGSLVDGQADLGVGQST